MSTRRRTFGSTPVVFAIAMVAISACGGSSSPVETVATPTFSPGAGAVNVGQTVTIAPEWYPIGGRVYLGMDAGSRLR